MAAPTNQDIASAFQLLGDLLAIDGADRHRILAYHRGAARVRATSESVAAMASAGRAVELAGIGTTLQAKMVELVDTGQIAALQTLTGRLPAGLADIAHLEGIGPKRARAIYDALGISSLDALVAAAADGSLSTVAGIGPKLVAAVTERAAAGTMAAEKPRMLASQARTLAEELVAGLGTVPGTDRIVIAGSLRRGRETIGDIDLIASTTDPGPLLTAFAELPAVASVVVHGALVCAVMTQTGMRAELRTASPEHFGNLLQHATGSAAHNIRLREAAVKRGASISELAITEADGSTVSFAEEDDFYRHLGLPVIPPELREDVGELSGQIPTLVEVADIRGDLHMHTDWSDGRATLGQMVAAAEARGYAYIAITDHSHGLAMVGGLTPERVKRQWDAIDEANAKTALTILKGVELEILSDGRLDFDDELLAGFDVVVASIHSGFQQSPERITQRLLAAIENPHVDIMGHPTGRRIGRRPPLEFDIDHVFERAAATGTLLEINGQAERQDLSDQLARRALGMGCRLVVSSDAHVPEGLMAIERAVTIARRAGAEAKHIANVVTDWSQRPEAAGTA